MRIRRSTLSTRLLLLGSGALVAAPLAACGSDDTADSEAATGGEGATQVTLSDAWVRASEGPMTGVFGVITNPGDTDVTVVSASTSASEMTELHEVVMIDGEMKMKEKNDGFVVPAGGEHVLEPGADHVMVMNMQNPIMPGDDVEITLTLDDGSEVSYTAQAREAEVGDEEYVPSDGDMHGGMEGEMEDSQS